MKLASTTSRIDSTQCPPFIFKEDITFNSLLKLVAVAAEATVDCLAVTQLHWKFEIPAKGQYKLISNAVRLQTMMKVIMEKKGNPVVFFYLSKPIPTAKFATAVDENLELDVAQNSMKSLISAIRKENSELQPKLDEAYPIGNHLLFPGKCIYAGDSKQFWELTDIRMEVWANAIAKDCAMLTSPPTSAHFTATSTVKPHWPPPDASHEVLVAYSEYSGSPVPTSHFNQVATPFNLALHGQQAPAALPPIIPAYPCPYPPFAMPF
ncbi:hypothetical protein BS17DRAFT_822073 [Gyrodon lividus]|nr:hypothetical protein BS17DRAFT_822073 [Gyrodon lividus]